MDEVVGDALPEPGPGSSQKVGILRYNLAMLRRRQRAGGQRHPARATGAKMA